MYDRDQVIEKINKYYDLGESASESWYSEAHSFCVSLSEKYNQPVFIVAGIVAALSVRTRWEVNKEMTIAFLQDKVVRHLPRQINIVKSILLCKDSEDVYILLGNKTKSFYINILHPEFNDHVTLDSHMIKGLLNKQGICNKRYMWLSTIIRYEATKRKLKGHELQARVWEAIRKKK